MNYTLIGGELLVFVALSSCLIYKLKKQIPLN